MASRSRRQVKVPKRFRPGANDDGDDADAIAEEQPVHAHDVRSQERIAATLELLTAQTEKQTVAVCAAVAGMIEEMAKQTRQMTKAARALNAIEDSLLDIHEAIAKAQPLSSDLLMRSTFGEAAKKKPKQDGDDEVVISLQASAEGIPNEAIAQPPAAAPEATVVPEIVVTVATDKEPNFADDFPTACIPPQVWARMNKIEK
jgi:hypothetical protein